MKIEKEIIYTFKFPEVMELLIEVLGTRGYTEFPDNPGYLVSQVEDTFIIQGTKEYDIGEAQNQKYDGIITEEEIMDMRLLGSCLHIERGR